MSGAYAIVNQLLNTQQSTAVGVGHVLRVLLNFTKPAGSTPIIVEHTNKDGATRTMMFSRQKLSTTFSSAIDILKYDLGIVQRGYYSGQATVSITGALFYNDDGSVQSTPVLVSQESWPDLMAHVHKVFVRST